LSATVKRQTPRTFRMAFPILRCLALNGPNYPYAIETQAKVDHPTTLQAIGLLERAGLIRREDSLSMRLPNGIIRTTYSITRRGIVALLQYHKHEGTEWAVQNIRELARRNAEFLPLVFGKWKQFEDNGVEDLAHKLLTNAVAYCESEFEYLQKLSQNERDDNLKLAESVHRHRIYKQMFLYLPRQLDMLETPEQDRWLNLIRGDQEILDMSTREVQSLKSELQDQIRFLDNSLAEIQGLPSRLGDGTLAKPGVMRVTMEQDRAFDWLEKYQADALDEGRIAPNSSEIMNEALANLEQEHRSEIEENWKRKRH
jgi:DNA-binding MarR family transcriptional regulator